MNNKRAREIKKIVRTMFDQVEDKAELKRIIKLAKKMYVAHKGKKEKNERNDKRRVQEEMG